MLKNDTLNEIHAILGFDAMVKVIGMQAIVHTTKPVVLPVGSFHEKCLRKFSRLLGESEGSADYAMRVLLGGQDYETRQSFQGLGGCVPYSLRQCLVNAGAIVDDNSQEDSVTPPRQRP